jgi:hypothetical protein
MRFRSATSAMISSMVLSCSTSSLKVEDTDLSEAQDTHGGNSSCLQDTQEPKIQSLLCDSVWRKGDRA